VIIFPGLASPDSYLFDHDAAVLAKVAAVHRVVSKVVRPAFHAAHSIHQYEHRYTSADHVILYKTGFLSYKAFCSIPNILSTGEMLLTMTTTKGRTEDVLNSLRFKIEKTLASSELNSAGKRKMIKQR
jgi:hypothetical protein